MNPEIQAKTGTLSYVFLFFMAILWQSANVISVYSYFHSNYAAATTSIALQIFSLFVAVVFMFRWFRFTAARQKSSFIRLDQLNVHEYIAVSYIIPIIVQGVVFHLWTIIANEPTWQSRSTTTLIIHWATNYALFLAIISKQLF